MAVIYNWCVSIAGPISMTVTTMANLYPIGDLKRRLVVIPDYILELVKSTLEVWSGQRIGLAGGDLALRSRYNGVDQLLLFVVSKSVALGPQVHHLDSALVVATHNGHLAELSPIPEPGHVDKGFASLIPRYRDRKLRHDLRAAALLYHRLHDDNGRRQLRYMSQGALYTGRLTDNFNTFIPPKRTAKLLPNHIVGMNQEDPNALSHLSPPLYKASHGPSRGRGCALPRRDRVFAESRNVHPAFGRFPSRLVSEKSPIGLVHLGDYAGMVTPHLRGCPSAKGITRAITFCHSLFVLALAESSEVESQEVV